MTAVFRRHKWMFTRAGVPAVSFHAVTAILALVLLFKALGS
jgi:hypothetical protein